MASHLKAVIFDMDGVITDTMPYHYRAWRQIFKDNGIHVSKFDVYRREGQKGIESVREIFAEAGKPVSVDGAKQILLDKEKLFKQTVRRKFIIGARSFIKRLHAGNIRLALVTGTARHEVERTLPPQLLRLFDVVVTGSDVVQGKPHPEPYLKALKALRVLKREALVVENAPFGIMSAKAAGLRCYAIETSLPAKYLNADRIFKSHKELGQYFYRRYKDCA